MNMQNPIQNRARYCYNRKDLSSICTVHIKAYYTRLNARCIILVTHTSNIYSLVSLHYSSYAFQCPMKASRSFGVPFKLFISLTAIICLCWRKLARTANKNSIPYTWKQLNTHTFAHDSPHIHIFPNTKRDKYNQTLHFNTKYANQ